MKLAIAIAVATLGLGAADAWAADAEAGQKTFERACRSCHGIVAADGTVVVKGGKTGPDLFGVMGRAAAASDSFTRYGTGIQEAAAAGLVWNEEEIIAYLSDPTKYIRDKAGDPRARSNMSYKLTKSADAENVAAFLATQQ